MNNSKKTGFQTAKFNQNNDEKRFKERSVGEKSAKKPQSAKSDKNRPHFARQEDERRNERRHGIDNRNEMRGKSRSKGSLADKVKQWEQQITQTTMENASGSGKVKVMIKSSVPSDKPREKKTGPLSPRAPEKIKKNRAEEMKVYGESTCFALFAQRPDSIVRVWATVEMAHKTGEMFSYLAAHKKVYHVVDNQELALVSGSEHHGGICMLVKKARPFTLSGYLDIPRSKDCLVLLDGVRNAYNVGGILRTCAFYGIKGVITDDAETLNSAAAMRVAEGGAEYIHSLQTDDIRHALNQLRTAGYQIVHTTIDKQAVGFAKVRLENKTVFVLNEGSTASLVEKGDTVTNLSFANPLNKNGLNVAVQAGVLLARWVEL